MYLQIYRQMREDIIRGVYPYGSRLPSKRDIADKAGVSTVTAEHAYALLCEEGYVEARMRSGYFVIFRTSDGFAGGTASPCPAPYRPAIGQYRTASNTAAPAPHAADARSQYDFPFPLLAKTMRRVISEYGDALMQRSPNAGLPALREAIAQYLDRSRGIQVATEQIIVGSGSEYLYGLIVDLLGRQRLYAIESPSYKKIRQVYQGFAVQYEMLPLGADGIESDALWASEADVLHITPYRSFPSGVTAGASKRHEYMRWAAQARPTPRYIVEDDFESEFSVSRKPEETLFSHTAADNVLYLNTFSRTISPSLRAGYMVLPRHLQTVFVQKLGFRACTVPTFEQLVLAELLTNGDFERHINRVRRQKRRDALKRDTDLSGGTD